jgi:hypothetical protein
VTRCVGRFGHSKANETPSHLGAGGVLNFLATLAPRDLKKGLSLTSLKGASRNTDGHLFKNPRQAQWLQMSAKNSQISLLSSVRTAVRTAPFYLAGEPGKT